MLSDDRCKQAIPRGRTRAQSFNCTVNQFANSSSHPDTPCAKQMRPWYHQGLDSKHRERKVSYPAPPCGLQDLIRALAIAKTLSSFGLRIQLPWFSSEAECVWNYGFKWIGMTPLHRLVFRVSTDYLFTLWILALTFRNIFSHRISLPLEFVVTILRRLTTLKWRQYEDFIQQTS